MYATVAAITLLFILSACNQDTQNQSAALPTEPEPPVAAAAPDTLAAIVARAGAPLLDGLGDFNHPITTADPWAQRYFNQGMAMAAGFNHAESIRAFKAAQRLDPEVAQVRRCGARLPHPEGPQQPLPDQLPEPPQDRRRGR